MNIIEIVKSKKFITLASAALVLVILIAGIVTSSGAFASEVYFDLKIGEEKVAVFNTREEAEDVISRVKTAYVTEGSEVLATEVDPEMTIVETEYKENEKPDLANADKMVEYILTGTEEKVEYEVKENETLWDIAYENGFTVEQLIEMNPEKDPELIFVGDILNFYEMKPLVNVSTEEIVTYDKSIQYETEEVETSSLYVGQSEVEQQGAAGLENVTEQIKSLNGKTVESEVKETKVIKEAVKEVINVGTASRPVATAGFADGRTYSGDGGAVASLALQSVGCPYIYGGSSLSGADCSGFVMAVYRNFGVSLPHGAVSQRYYGRSVPLGSALPGDIICNPGHVGIYIGGGQMVHAMNEYAGITVSSVYVTGPVLDVRRIFE